MELKVLGSSSRGNCYILDNKKEALIIEVGVSFMDVKKALDFQISRVVGCLITHRHNDHAKYAKTVVECGIYTLALPEVFEEKGIKSGRAIPIQFGKGYKFGNFKVLPFPAKHDVPCSAFIIEHPETGRILFLTDSYAIDYNIPGLSNILIECNYSDRKLIESIDAGITMPFQRTRLIESHMELSSCKSILRSIDLNRVMNIILIHLSENNGDEDVFVSEIQRETGKVVYAAKPGLNIELSKM
ncbi:MAG TPA: MBL fold hydrolase [Porphyromonadaceae bacterium]|nr:MBL fold hydrolase [Porphyromonadaceae bacterium]